jgi:hypothetical protein
MSRAAIWSSGSMEAEFQTFVILKLNVRKKIKNHDVDNVVFYKCVNF